MEQPLTPNSSSPKETTTDNNNNNNKRRPPSPEEVLAHYESQGLDSKQASLKAISDLQTLLFRSVSARRGNKDHRLTADAARKLDTVNTRLAILEMKLDSKPGFLESIAIGVTSGAILHAIGSATPHVARIWDAVKSAITTKSSPH